MSSQGSQLLSETNHITKNYTNSITSVTEKCYNRVFKFFYKMSFPDDSASLCSNYDKKVYIEFLIFSFWFFLLAFLAIFFYLYRKRCKADRFLNSITFLFFLIQHYYFFSLKTNNHTIAINLPSSPISIFSLTLVQISLLIFIFLGKKLDDIGQRYSFLINIIMLVLSAVLYHAFNFYFTISVSFNSIQLTSMLLSLIVLIVNLKDYVFFYPVHYSPESTTNNKIEAMKDKNILIEQILRTNMSLKKISLS